MQQKHAAAEVEVTAKDKTKQGIDSAKKGVGALTKVAKAYFAEIAAAYAAMRGLINVIKDTTQAYIVQENAVTELDTAMRATGIYTPDLSKELQTLASQLQNTTTYGDEAILSMGGLLQSMGHLSGEGLKTAMPLVLDMATSLKMDLNTAASLVAKTLGSSTNALARYGFEMKKGMTDTEKMGALQDWIAGRFKGSAAAAATTFGGKITQIKNVIGDVKEVIGKMLLEQGAPFINWLLDFLKNSENIQVIGKIVQGFGAVFTTVFAVIVAAIKTTINYYKIWAEAIMAVNRMVDVLFHPKKWGTGEIKAAFQDLGAATAKIGKETWDMWIENGKRVGNAWGKMFQDVDMTITTTSSNISYGIGNATDEASGSVKDLTDKLIGLKDVTAYLGVDMGVYARAQREAEAASTALAATAVEQTNVQEVMGQMMYSTGQVLDEQGRKAGALAVMFKALQMEHAELAQFVAGSFVDQMTSGFDAIMTGSKDLKEGLKDMVAGFLQSLGKLYFVQFLSSLIFAPRKAAGFLVASIAAYAGAALVRSLAKGGEFETHGPELIMVGDNPSGRERVSVTPTESPEYQASKPMVGDVYFDGFLVGKWILRESYAKNVKIYKGAIVE